MQQDLRERIRAATEESGITKPAFVELLRLVSQHYDKMEATITQSVQSRVLHDNTPIEAIFDSVTDALLTVGANGVIRNCNKVCASYFGIPKNKLIGSEIATILPEARGQSLAKFLSRFMTSVDDTRVESDGFPVQAMRAGSEPFVSEIRASKLDINERPVFVISLRDVTDRKQAESVLRENEERYRALVENAPEAIIVLDVDEQRFTDANDNACTLFNLSRARLLKVGPEAISPKMQPDGTPSFGIRRGFIDRALAGEHPTFEWMHRDSSGREFPCEVRFSRLPSDERRLIRVSINDIAERKRNEASSFAQNKVLEMIAANTPHDSTLRAICRYSEKIGEHFKVAIMRLDPKSQTLSVEQAPSLSDPFKLCLEFIKVDAGSLTCGAAVHQREDRITEDIHEDAGWSKAGKEAAKHRIRAAWSFLVYGAAGRVIGTLDVYVDEPRAPTTEELDKLSQMARLAGIAIKRQQDEEKLRSSEARYRGLFENVVDGVYISSREGEIIAANPALVEMLGYDSVEDLRAAGKTTVLYVNPIDRERVFARLEAKGVVKNFEYRLRRKDGSTIVVLENSRAVYDDAGFIVAHEGTITDITDRKRAETRVFEEKERAQITLQSIGDGVITTDADGKVDYINPVAQDLIGRDMRSSKGNCVTEIMTIVNEHTRATVENPVIRCLKDGRVTSLAENSILITANGEEVPIQDSAA
ncbi:MAG: PAS domain S-box protein, partial [Woeseiaceae bacterium]